VAVGGTRNSRIFVCTFTVRVGIHSHECWECGCGGAPPLDSNVDMSTGAVGLRLSPCACSLGTGSCGQVDWYGHAVQSLQHGYAQSMCRLLPASRPKNQSPNARWAVVPTPRPPNPPKPPKYKRKGGTGHDKNQRKGMCRRSKRASEQREAQGGGCCVFVFVWFPRRTVDCKPVPVAVDVLLAV